MSNFLAIATVTETLRAVLEAAVKADVSGAHATAVRPSGTNNTGTGGGLPATGVNVFLYQIMPNAAGRNLDLPTRRADASAIQKPRAAIDLHYMLTAYGQESTLEPQRVMGTVVRTLASRAILSRKAIEDAAGGVTYLASQDLSVDVELVKLTPLGLTLDELSRVWSVFFQTSYALSVCYQASVVFLEEATPVVSALPVKTPNILVRPIERPVIQSIAPQPAHAGDTITITGTDVGRGVPYVRIGDADPILAKVKGAREIEVALPLASTRAGVSAVRVVQKIDFGTGTPSEPHAGYESNVAALALAPRVISPAAGDSLAHGTTITVTVDAPVGRTQEAALILGSRRIPVPQRSAGDPDASTTLKVTLPDDLTPGPALLRFQVEGVDSPLDVDPVTGAYTGPTVAIT